LPPPESSAPVAVQGADGAPSTSWSELPIPGHEPAIVSSPDTTEGGRPVVVTAQGLTDDPRQWCEWCRSVVRDRAYVLCLRGRATGQVKGGEMSYAHTSVRGMSDEATQGLRALKGREGDRVDTRDALFLGFSLGAQTGAQVVLETPATFPRAVLIEAGNEIWDRKTAPRYHAGGGRRILFACGTEGCWRWAEFSRKRLEKAGVAVKIALGEGGGHAYKDGAVNEALRGAFDWVVEDDVRWQRGEARAAAQ